MQKIREIIENVSPVLIQPGTGSVTIGISKRFFLFQLMNRIINLIEEEPHLNFIAALKSYKVLGRFLYGTLHEFYRDRNRVYFKNFFLDKRLYELVRADLEYLHPKYSHVNMTITKRGLVIYDNYRKNSFNVLLMTCHSGTYLPKYVGRRLALTDQFRHAEEDIDTHRIYSKLVLEKGGIWIDNKLSRFAIDFNRNITRAIYESGSEVSWQAETLWNSQLTSLEKSQLYEAYKEFYFTLARLVETYRFNIIFDAHSMKDLPGRPEVSFGIKYVPRFYLPIVRSMRQKLQKLGYQSEINRPYSGGYILNWMSVKFPDVFIFSMEVNKKLYMGRDMQKTIEAKMEKLSADIAGIFDIEVGEFDKAS